MVLRGARRASGVALTLLLLTAVAVGIEGQTPSRPIQPPSGVPPAPPQESGAAPRGWIGILYSGGSEGSARLETTPDGRNGIRIRAVADGSPADRAGLRSQDLVLGIDGTPVSPSTFARDGGLALAPGDTLVVEYLRGDRRMETRLVVAASPVDRARRRVENMGLYLDSIRRELRGELDSLVVRRRSDLDSLFGRGRPGEIERSSARWIGLEPPLSGYFGDARGVLLLAMDADGPEARAGLQPGDVVITADGTGVDQPAGLLRILGRARGTPVPLSVLRKGATLSLTYGGPGR